MDNIIFIKREELNLIIDNKSNNNLTYFSKKKKLNKNIYLFIYYIYKYMLLKDFISKNYKMILNNNKVNLYFNVMECRFYYLYYYFLIKNRIYIFIKIYI